MAENRDNTNVANKILKILKQISEHLTQDEIITLRSSVTKARELSRVEFNNAKAKEFLRDHAKALQFCSGISVYLLKQSIRSLLMIVYNVALGEDVYERFTEYIVREHPSITIGMELDDELLKVYFKALESGYENAKHIRLMVVGMFHVGKTTLVHKLLNKPDAEKDHTSTDGIDISFDACEIDENGKWEITTFKEKEKGYLLRLQELFQSNKTAQEERKSTEKINVRTEQAQDVVMESNEENQAGVSEPRRAGNVSDKRKHKFKQESEKTELTQYYNEIEKANSNALQPNVATKRPTISIWDFAGQSVYYSTHHFFLNPRAIYLLVLDLSKELNEELDEETIGSGTKNLHLENTTTKHFTQLDAFQFWMRSIYIYTQQKQSNTSTENTTYRPTIILIGTHKDKIKKKIEDPDTYAKDYFKTALDSLNGIPGLREELICETNFFFGKGDAIDALREKINQVSEKQPFWNEKIPGKFIPLERHVVKKKSEGSRTMRFQELEEASNESHYTLEKKEIQIFLKFQHAFGNILHYDKANPDMVILDPRWLIDAFKLFITQQDSEELTELYTNAKLSDSVVDNLLKSEGNWFDYKEEILKYMESLDIIAKPVMFKGHDHSEDTVLDTTSSSLALLKEDEGSDRWVISLKTCGDTASENFYLMPCMLPPRPNAETIKDLLNIGTGKSSPVLCMYIGGVFLPPFIFHRILATCIKEMPIFMRNKTKVLYNGLGAFKIDDTTVLTIWSLDDMIYLKVTSYHRDNKVEGGKKKIANADLTKVQEYFESLVKRLFQIGGHQQSDKFNISYYITCPECPELFPFDKPVEDSSFPFDPLGQMFEVQEVRLLKTTTCISKVHHVTQHECLSQWFNKTTAIGELDTALLNRLYGKKPDSLFLADIAEAIDPDNINDLAKRLDIFPKQLKRIQRDHGKITLCYIFHILYIWSKRKYCSVRLLKIVTQLGCSEQDFIRMLDGTDSDCVKKEMEGLQEKIPPEKLDEIVLDEKNCAQIAESVGNEYWLLGIRLGVDEEFLLRESGNVSGKIEEFVRQVLMEWLNKSCLSNIEKNKQLIKAMVKCDCRMDVLLKIFI